MKHLSQNWFLEGLIDFEYKKYLLLAYLKGVNDEFKSTRLYPKLGELVNHFNNLRQFLDNKKEYYDNFPRRMKFEKFKIAYERVIKDDELMEEVESIVIYSKAQIKILVEEGKEIYDFIEDKINFEPVGVVPLRRDEGYFLLRSGASSSTYAFSFRISIFDGQDENYRAIKTNFIDEFVYSITRNYSTIKTELINRRKELPNPATYVFESGLQVPVMETFLPIAKRLLVKELAA